jgi:hypothetical protein
MEQAMSHDVSSRHAGDLGGVFLPFGDTNQVEVTVEIDASAAAHASHQHAAWMLINLLSRMEHVVQRVGIVCPAGIQMAESVVPLAPAGVELREALFQGAQEIGVVEIVADRRIGRLLAVGDTPLPGAALQVCGHGWQGGFSSTGVRFHSRQDVSLPFGPYIAACLAAAEVFKAARLKPAQYHCPQAAFLSLWDDQVSNEWRDDGSPTRLDLVIDAGLAGVGAVGCGFLHTLWATSGLSGQLMMADADVDGLEATNLNRYALFGRASVGVQKASAAARLLGNGPITYIPHDHAFEQLSGFPSRVVSAVDRNTARAGIQNRYPARLFSASTFNLRAEVLRCGPPGVGACLRCYNPPEVVESDISIRKRLRAATDEEIRTIVGAHQISVADARAWAETGSCGMTGERLLPLMRRSAGEQPFAVGFVSVLAGVALAAEFIKDHLDVPVPLTAGTQRFVFQFHNPLARSNKANGYIRDSECPMCDPASEAVKIWDQRWKSLSPSR